MIVKIIMMKKDFIKELLKGTHNDIQHEMNAHTKSPKHGSFIHIMI